MQACTKYLLTGHVLSVDWLAALFSVHCRLGASEAPVKRHFVCRAMSEKGEIGEVKMKHQNNYWLLVSKAFLKEMKCRNFLFGGGIYALFPFPTWMKMDIFYPAYRLILAVGLLAWLCAEIPLKLKSSLSSRNRFNYFCYLTNWSFIWFALSSFLFAIFTIYYTCKKGRRVNRWIAMVLWLFYGTAMNLAMVTCLMYWAVLSDSKLPEMASWASRLKHSLPLVLVFLDLLVDGLQIRILHFIYPVTFGIVYVIFSYLYFQFVDVAPLYPSLNWRMVPKSVGFILITILVAASMQLIMFVLFVGRTLLSYKLGGKGRLLVATWHGDPKVDCIIAEELDSQSGFKA